MNTATYAFPSPGVLDLEAIVAVHRDSLYRFALSLTHSEADASDLVQETFFTLTSRGFQLRDATKAKGWLFTTLHRVFLQICRRQTRFPHVHLDDAESDLPEVQPPDLTRLDSGHLNQALAELDPTYREALLLYYLEDLAYREIAEVLRVPIGTVKSRIARGILQLRKAFQLESC